MKGIPPELDRLMWALVEQDQSTAVDEFLRRYPIYREELLKRQHAVSGLKGGKPRVSARTHEIPRFTPRRATPSAPSSRQVVLVGSLVLAALAVASYTITSLVTPAAPPAEPPKSAQIQRPAPADLSPAPENPVKRPPIESGGAETNSGEPTSSAPTPNYLQPQSLVVKKATLPDVLKLLGAQAGVQIVIAPGMSAPTISVEYHDMNAMEILRDLGSRYSFTPFDQGDGTIVVYPAVDPSASGNPGNARRIGG